MRSTGNSAAQASHDAMMASNHYVLTISQHGHKLGTPNYRHAAQHIQEVGYHVENIFSNVSFEHWDGDHVQIGQDIANANADAHVKKQTIMMCAAIPSD